MPRICDHLHSPLAAKAVGLAAGVAVRVGHVETAVKPGLPAGLYHTQRWPKDSLPPVEGGARQVEGPLHAAVATLLSFFHCTCMNSDFRDQHKNFLGRITGRAV